MCDPELPTGTRPTGGHSPAPSVRHQAGRGAHDRLPPGRVCVWGVGGLACDRQRGGVAGPRGTLHEPSRSSVGGGGGRPEKPVCVASESSGASEPARRPGWRTQGPRGHRAPELRTSFSATQRNSHSRTASAGAGCRPWARPGLGSNPCSSGLGSNPCSSGCPSKPLLTSE